MGYTFKLVLLRHGESLWNVENIFTGWHDVDLSETGKMEAVEAGKCLKEKGFKFDIVFTSCLRRAIKTAWTALTYSENFAMPIVQTWRLNERHYGGLQGLNKADTAKKHGDDQVKIWRRSYDIPPPAIELNDPRHPANDPLYSSVPCNALPGAESLKTTVDRVLPFWFDNIAPCVMAGKSVLISAHGNSLRALCKYIEGMSEKEVLELNIPTAVPLVYELDEKLQFIRKYYLMDEAEVKAKMAAVANQGKADVQASAAPKCPPTAEDSNVGGSWLTAAQKAALKATADAMSAPGKGFLAADESAGPWLRAGNSEAAKIPDTVENRAAYRSLCFQTPGLSQYISGVIMHVETLFQTDAQGNKMVDLVTKGGMIPGIKLDKGYDKSGLAGTAIGPLGHGETWDKGIDDLEKRCAEAYAQGARFAKWRNVLQIDPAQGLPSALAIDVCVKNLAHYAQICQRNGLVPIVEPEIVPNGNHPIEACAVVTEKVLVAQFAALKLYNCYLEGAVLKPNMVKNGLAGPKAPPEVVAEKTISVLLRTVPPAMPGIFFLSGETALDEDNEETATINLNAMNKMSKTTPWSVSFSYGKALQKTCIVTWMGKTENVAKAQEALLNRCKANSEACKGTYVRGSCASIGTAGNAEMQGGAY
jgi:bisphosphoglycerate-dependent phosphoglycerate mutase family 1